MQVATGNSVSDSYRVSNVGRGLWYFLHVHAARSLGPEHIEILNAIIRSLADIFPCGAVCGSDLNSYLEANGTIGPDSTPLEALRWTYELHTSVNERTGKPNASWDEVRHYFMVDTPCAKFCGGEHAVASARPPEAKGAHGGRSHSRLAPQHTDELQFKRYRLTS